MGSNGAGRRSGDALRAERTLLGAMVCENLISAMSATLQGTKKLRTELPGMLQESIRGTSALVAVWVMRQNCGVHARPKGTHSDSAEELLLREEGAGGGVETGEGREDDVLDCGKSSRRSLYPTVSHLHD